MMLTALDLLGKGVWDDRDSQSSWSKGLTGEGFENQSYRGLGKIKQEYAHKVSGVFLTVTPQ